MRRYRLSFRRFRYITRRERRSAGNSGGNSGHGGIAIALLSVPVVFILSVWVSALLEVGVLLIFLLLFVAVLLGWSSSAPTTQSRPNPLKISDGRVLGQMPDKRGKSVHHKKYTATQIFPDKTNYVVSIFVESDNKEYFFTRSSIVRMKIQFSDVMPGSILMILDSYYFELGNEVGGITQAEAQSARNFVDFLKRCAGLLLLSN